MQLTIIESSLKPPTIEHRQAGFETYSARTFHLVGDTGGAFAESGSLC